MEKTLRPSILPIHHSLTLLFLFVVFMLALFAPPAFGQQHDFALRDYGYKTAYYFKWQDHQGRVHNTKFNLDRNMVQKAVHEFKPFSNNDANNYVYSTVSSYSRL